VTEAECRRYQWPDSNWKKMKVCLRLVHRRNNRKDRGRLVPLLLGWGTNNVLVPQLLGRSFQKSKKFYSKCHQNAGFSMSFQKFSGGDTPRPSQREGATPSRTQPQPGLWPGAGRKRPGVGTKPWSPSTFQPWLRPWTCVAMKFVYDDDDNDDEDGLNK